MLLFSGEGLAGSQRGLPRVTRPVGGGAGFGRRPAVCRAQVSRYVRGGAGCRGFLHVKAPSGPRPGLSLHPEREPGPWSRLQRPLPFRVPGLSKLTHFDPVFGEGLPRPELGAQRWAWGAPLLLGRAVNESTPWLPATVHGPPSDAGSAVVSRRPHERLIKVFSF